MWHRGHKTFVGKDWTRYTKTSTVVEKVTELKPLFSKCGPQTSIIISSL